MAVNSAFIFQMLTEMLREKRARETTDKQLALQAIKTGFDRDAQLQELDIARDTLAHREKIDIDTLAHTIFVDKETLADKDTEHGLMKDQIDISRETLEVQKQGIFKKDIVDEELLVSQKIEDVGGEIYSTFLSGFVSEAWETYAEDGTAHAQATMNQPGAKWDWHQGKEQMRILLGKMPEAHKDLIINRTTEYQKSVDKGLPKYKLMYGLGEHIKDMFQQLHTENNRIAREVKNANPDLTGDKLQAKIEASQETYYSGEGEDLKQFLQGLGKAGIIYNEQAKKDGWFSRWSDGGSQPLDLAVNVGRVAFEEVFKDIENIDLAKKLIAIEGSHARMYGDYDVDVSVLPLLEGGQEWLDAGGMKVTGIEQSLMNLTPGSDEYYKGLGGMLFSGQELNQDLQQKYGFVYDKNLGEYKFNLPGVDYSPGKYDDMVDEPNKASIQYDDLSGDVEALSNHIQIFSQLEDDYLTQQKNKISSGNYNITSRAIDDTNIYEIGKVLEVLEWKHTQLDDKRLVLEPLYLEQQNVQKKK